MDLALVAVCLDHDWEESGREFQLAMSREPVPPTVRHLGSVFHLLPLGRIEEAIREVEGALKEDPLNVLCRVHLGICLWAAGRFDGAIRQIQQTLEIDESFGFASMIQGLLYVRTGKIEQALAFAEKAYAVDPRNFEIIGTLAGALSRFGDRQRSERLVQELGDGESYGAPMGFFLLHLVREEKDKAADWVAKVIDQRYPNILAAMFCFRNEFESVCRWRGLTGLLDLPETATKQSI